MLTLNYILKEINELLAEKLNEVYDFVHSVQDKKKQPKSSRKKILSFAVAFQDMSEKGYVDVK
jgi:hypothetical protein